MTTKAYKPTSADVRAWVEKNLNVVGIFGSIPSRSCWTCNPSHEHLRKVEYPFHCFECGHVFFHGVEVVADGMKVVADDAGASASETEQEREVANTLVATVEALEARSVLRGDK